MRIKNPDILNDFRGPGPCEACGQPCRVREPHHLLSRGASGSDIKINLISLGSTLAFECFCHSAHHNGNSPYTEELREIVARRENTSPEDIVDVTNLILRLPKDPPMGLVEAEILTLTVSAQKLAWQVLSQTGVVG